MNQKQIVVIGLNHKTAPVALRERLAVSPMKLPEALSAFTHFTGLSSCVFLSTCNRIEIYTLLSSLDGELSRAKDFFSDYHRIEKTQYYDALYMRVGKEGVEHLFKVASGLDSLVLGESEILGQVKQAYQIAHEEKKVEKLLHLLFQRTLRVAKKVRTETGIGRGHLSVGSAAVEMAEKIFGSLRGRTILVIGAGKMGELTARHLLKGGACSIFVSSRSLLRAEALAKELEGNAVTFDQLLKQLEKVDIAISSTASPHPVVTEDQIAHVMKKRCGRPLFLMDIAVPRDIDPHANRIENVFLYDIDDLEKITRSGYKERSAEMEKGLSLIQGEAEKLIGLLQPVHSSG